MKKLLILLLLIPTLIQAEEFKLVCEGERVLNKSDSDVFRIKKSIVVKVRKDSIRAEDETYYNGKSARFEGSYIQDEDSISAMTVYTEAPSKSSCSVVGHDLSINLIEETVYITKRETNECKKKGYFTKIDFTGNCKKQILLAFEAFDDFIANGTNLAPTNEMCNVDEGDIRNKGNRLRKKCF
ncbi:hypothetical protein N9542_02310 [Methylophilaceae bacterium]|jgi:hypothetical protein|nr:hypothetical protein [Methylophilaceae bacterium]